MPDADVGAAPLAIWEAELGELLSPAEIRELVGVASDELIEAMLRARRLIGLRDSAGRLHFPRLQAPDRRLLEPLIAAYWVVADAAISDWTAASWCAAPDDALDGLSPAQWARDG